MALKFLNKKGWHTGSLRNIENVWKAEQKHDAEQKKLEELKKQIQEEREKAEFRLIQEQAGLVPKQERLDFLYDSGLAVGKSSTDGFKELETLPKPGNEVASSSSTKPSVPGALFDEKPQSANDTWRKLHSDPLLMIRQREQEALARVRNNPVQMAMIRKSVETKKHKNTGDKKERKKIRERNLEDQRHSSLSPPRDSENATFEKKEKRNKSDKYDEHYSKTKRDSELFDERGGGHRKKDGDKYDEHYSKTRRDSELNGERGGGHRKKDGDKYDENYSKTMRDSELYDERGGHRKKVGDKYDEHYSKTKQDSELFDERGGHRKKDGDKYDEHYSKTKRDSELFDERGGHKKKDGDKYDEHYSKTKRDAELFDERGWHRKKDGDKDLKYKQNPSRDMSDPETAATDGHRIQQNLEKSKRDKYNYDDQTTSTAPKKYEASSSNHSGVTVQRDSQYKRRKTAPKISEEERAARLREMQVDAELHEEQRWKRLKKADEVDANEATKAAGMSGGKNFLDVAHTKVYGAEKGGSSTIEESVRRRTHYSQGRSEATGNAFRR